MADQNSQGITESALPASPGSWAPARRLVRKALAPVERFLAIEASSGMLLVLVAVVALVWGNSPWRVSYDHLWHTPSVQRHLARILESAGARPATGDPANSCWVDGFRSFTGIAADCSNA